MTQEMIVFQPETNFPTSSTMGARGSFDEWKGKLIPLIKDRPYLITFLSAAFAGPLLKPAREDSFGIHIYGLSSRGKTTALQTGASVWGNGSDPAQAPDESFVLTWNTTANALEALCASHNDCVMFLDEIHKCAAKDVGQVIYNITGGQGKSALSADRNLKSVRKWRIVLLSSGERSGVEMIERKGEKAKGGQQVRFLDVPIVGEILPDARTAEAIKAVCSDNYGHAGLLFVQRLIDQTRTFEQLRNFLTAAQNASVAGMPVTDSPEKARALKHFALVKTAGLLANELLDLGLDSIEIIESINTVASAWLGAADTLPDIERGFIALREFIIRHRESRFKLLPQDKDDRKSIPNLAGYWDKDNSKYYLTSQGMKEALEGFNVKAIKSKLKEDGHLDTNESDHMNIKIPSIDTRGYCIKGSFIENEELDK